METEGEARKLFESDRNENYKKWQLTPSEQNTLVTKRMKCSKKTWYTQNYLW